MFSYLRYLSCENIKQEPDAKYVIIRSHYQLPRTKGADETDTSSPQNFQEA